MSFRNLGVGQNHVVDPIRAGACGRVWRRHVGHAHMLDGVGSVPDNAGRYGIIAPTDVCGVEKIGQRGMIEAGINQLGLVAVGIDKIHPFLGRGETAGVIERVWAVDGILGCEQIAARAGRGGASKHELVCRETGPLVGLEHAVAKGVGFSELEIRRYVGGSNGFEPWIGWRAILSVLVALYLYFFDAIHFATVIEVQECRVSVAQIIIGLQGFGVEGNLRALQIDSVGLDVGASLDQDRILKQIIGGPIFLEYDDYVLNF